MGSLEDVLEPAADLPALVRPDDSLPVDPEVLPRRLVHPRNLELRVEDERRHVRTVENVFGERTVTRLALFEGALAVLALGDVVELAVRPDELALVVVLYLAGERDDDGLAVAPAHLELHLRHPATLFELREARLEALRRCLGEEVLEPLADDLGAVVPKLVEPGVVDHE